MENINIKVILDSDDEIYAELKRRKANEFTK